MYENINKSLIRSTAVWEAAAELAEIGDSRNKPWVWWSVRAQKSERTLEGSCVKV